MLRMTVQERRWEETASAVEIVRAIIADLPKSEVYRLLDLFSNPMTQPFEPARRKRQRRSRGPSEDRDKKVYTHAVGK